MITIIGAGPAGLAMAAELTRRNRPYRLIERGRVGEAWHHHYDRLRLHTLKHVSGLPGFPMPSHYPDFPSRAQFLEYLHQYAQHFDLRIEEGIELRRADIDGDRWRLDTSCGEADASVLVMATGIWSAPVRPRLPGEERFAGLILHSRDYRNPHIFRGQRVLVVGAGNSGAEIAVDLAGHGVETAIVVRSGVAFVPRPRSAAGMRLAAWLLRTLPPWLGARLLRRRNFQHLGLPLPPGSPLLHYPVVGYELPLMVAQQQVTVYPGVAQIESRSVVFQDGRRAAFDAIILATGYRPALDPVAHLIACDASGRPIVDRYWRARRHPTLVCIGYTYPTTEGWLQALGRVVRAAAHGIATQADTTLHDRRTAGALR